MIGARVRVRTNRDAAGAVRDGVREALSAAADEGFAVSQREVPHGATSGLANSGVPPAEQADGSIVWGYSAPYARDVEEGTPPHLAPFRAIRKWARRVLGDERAAGGVWRKIAREGTDPQPYVQPGIDAMVATIRTHGLGGAIEEAL